MIGEIPSKANIPQTREIDKPDCPGGETGKKQVARQQKIKQIRASVNKSQASIGLGHIKAVSTGKKMTDVEIFFGGIPGDTQSRNCLVLKLAKY